MSHQGEIASVPNPCFQFLQTLVIKIKKTGKGPEYNYVSPYVKFKIYVTLSITLATFLVREFSSTLFK